MVGGVDGTGLSTKNDLAGFSCMSAHTCYLSCFFDIHCYRCCSLHPGLNDACALL